MNKEMLLLFVFVLVICSTQTLQCIMTNNTLHNISNETLKQQLTLTAMYRK